MEKTILALGTLLAVGCASHPAPTEQLATSLAAVRAAQEAGATQVPEAALHLQLAQEQLNKAKKTEDGARAEGLALRATQDAELARALAHENDAKQRLQQLASSMPSAGGEQAPAMPAPARAQ